jgi:HAD superfamily hydrolase (TIGR01509 family)
MPATTVAAAVMDLDDTLLATGRARLRALHLIRAWGIDPRRFRAADDEWWRRYRNRECSLEEMWVGRWIELGIPAGKALELDRAYRAAKGSANLRSGAAWLLRSLRDAGVRIAILSNGASEPQRLKISQTGLDRLVDGVVVTGELGFHKPDARAFEAALALLGARADQSAIVGDMLHSDVEGGLAAGFRRVIWLATGPPHPNPRVVTVRGLREVLPALLGT